MKKITIMGIAVGAVLTIGIFANIGLFGNNALAAQPTMEEKIKTIFWSVTNQQYGLKKIMNGMHDMKNDMNAMDQDLLQKKSFYEVEDEDTIVDSSNKAVSVKLVNCDDAIPLEKRAFNIETLGVRMSNFLVGSTMVRFNDIVVDKTYRVTERVDETLFDEDPSLAFTEQIGASDSVQYNYNPSLFEADATNGITLTDVAIGQMPQGCEIEVDAVAEREIAVFP